MTFKDDVRAIASRIIEDHGDWKFVKQAPHNRWVFRNSAVPFVDRIIDPSFSYKNNPPDVLLQPLVAVRNRRTGQIYRRVFGVDEFFTSWINFNWEYDDFGSTRVVRERNVGDNAVWHSKWLTLVELPDLLSDILHRGSQMFEKYYDLSSEPAFLSNLPLLPGLPPAFATMMMIEQCIGHIAIGDFDFVRRFDRRRFKAKVELFDKLVESIPVLSGAADS